MVTKVRTLDFLPEIFRTKTNQQFLAGSLDQLVQQPEFKRIQGYIGSTFGYGVNANDKYLVEPDKTRQDYQLDPAVIFKKPNTDRAMDLLTYPGLLDTLSLENINVKNNNNLFKNEFYSWDSFVDLDKLINFSQYYWLPNGPDSVTITNATVFDKLDYTVTAQASGYNFSAEIVVIDGFNPTLTLVRGGKYTFKTTNTSGFWIQSEPGVSGVNSTRKNFSTREILGVSQNGSNSVSFDVPFSDAQDTWLFANSMPIDIVSTRSYDEIQGKPVSEISEIDGVPLQSLEGKTLLFYGNKPDTIGTRSDFFGDDYDTDDYSEAVYTEINKHYYTITLAGTESNPIIDILEGGLLPDDTNLVIQYGATYSGRKFVKNSYAEILLIPYFTAPLGTLYYQDPTNPSLVGVIEIIDPVQLPMLDVRTILGKKTYTSANNVTFTNGLKVNFVGNVFPTEYATGDYYVEGVGTAIELLPVEFFDTPAIPEINKQDYITIARNSLDKNEWSRSNRWFHIEVLQATIDYNLSSPISLAALGNVDNRAKRPIIEFYPNLQLFNSGTINRENVSYINFAVTDAFSQVAGTPSFSPDGSTAIVDGDTIIFAGDTNLEVRNKIYTARLSEVTPDSTPVITLSESNNGQVLFNQQVTIAKGSTYKQLSFYFNGLNWLESQTKERKNQSPLFDVRDSNNNSFGDVEYYPSSTFKGCTLFEYATGTGTDDPVLGFPIKYSAVDNFGDIVFTNSLNTQTFEYLLNSISTLINVDSGYVFKYSDRSTYTRQIGWQTAIESSFQYQVFNKEYTGVPVTPSFVLDVKIKDSTNTQWPTLVVYVNDVRISAADYTVTTTDNSTTITLVKTPALGTKVDIMAYSDQASFDGYYQIPTNLDRNPFNEMIETLSLGDIRGHYKSICNNAPSFAGLAFGSNNYRDLGNMVPYGTKIIQNSASLVSAGAFLRNKYDFFNALTFNSNQYVQYKSLIVDTISRNDYTTSDSTEYILDDVLEKIASIKSDTNPFFWSDMLPNKNAFSTKNYVFRSSLDTSIFQLSRIYDFSSANYYGVLVYLTRRVNGQVQQTLLLKDIDYVISNVDKSLTVTKDLVSGDMLTVKEYNQTYGSYVPNTPTKLGLYPSYTPEIVFDTTYRYPTYFIKGHDGSYTKLYGTYENGILSDLRDRVLLDFEKRVFNNLKTSNKIPVGYDEVVPGQFRDVGYSLEEFTNAYSVTFLNWVGSNRIDYESHDYLSSNPYTYNYKSSTYKFNGAKISQGSWRGIYLWLYDTITPNTTPWQMLGFTEQPSWWESKYGLSPYTSDNTVMWNDIANGYIWNNGNPYVNPQRVRADLLSILPVDSEGSLKSPFDFLLGVYDMSKFSNPWMLGDAGPAEYSYIKSSNWPFDLIRLTALLKPAKFFGLSMDVDNYRYNDEFKQFLVDNRYRNYITTATVYGNGTAAHSYMNWLVDYVNQYQVDGHDYVSTLINNLDVRLTYRLAGFSDKDLLNFYVEKGSNTSKNNSLLIPDESYAVMLYNNQPIDFIVYSSIIVQKTTNGYKVYGNGQDKTFFTALIPNTNGVTDIFTVNGNTIRVPRNYFDRPILVPYGFEFPSITELATFMRGYGLYLQNQGVKFNDVENGLELSWDQMIYETYYWTLTGWDVGSTININPCARNISIDKESRIIQPLTVANENFILNQNLLPISLSDLFIFRSGTEFNAKTLNQGDAIALIRANLSTIEHVIVFDNITVFNDVIYNHSTGLRQQRIYVKGSKTAEWNGTMNAAGFIINQDNVIEWAENTKYTKGNIVKYKNEYYIANEVVIIPSPTFDYNKWTKTSYDMIQKGLLPNPSTKAYESTLYYDKLIPNLENDADLLAFSLIGYRPRDYFADANLDDATQVNLYSNMIPSKGTVDSVTKLEGINLRQNTLNYDVHENWAIKTTEYGGLLNQNFIEVTLDENLLTGNPSIAGLVGRNSIAGVQQEIPLYKIKNYGRSVSTTDILPTITQGYQNKLPSAGYVNLDDVIQYGYTVNDLPDVSIEQVYKNDYLYVADRNSTWQIYTPVSTTALVINVTNNLNNTATITFDKPHNLFKNQILGIVGFDPRVDGYHVITSIVDLNNVIVPLSFTTGVTSIAGTGISYLLQSQRVQTTRDIPSLPLLNSSYSQNKVWVDNNVDGNWTVYEKTNNYQPTPFTKSVFSTGTYGSSVAYIPNFGYLVGDPTNGTVYVYEKADNGVFFLKETLTYPGSLFGTAIAYSDDIVVITSPGPSNGISQVYVYKIPTSNIITNLALEQIITFGGTIGKSITISGDSNLLYIGSEDNNIVVLFQRDRVLNFVGSGLILKSPTVLGSKQFSCTGNVVSSLKSGQRISFSTQYTNLGVTTYYPITELTNEFKVLGDQSGLLAYGDQVTFNNTGSLSTRVYTVGSFYVEPEVSFAVTGTFGNGTYAVVFFAAQPIAPFQVGEKIVVSGVTPTAFNGTYTVVLCTTTFVSYVSTATGSMTVAGTVKSPEITVFNTIETFETGTNIPVGNSIYEITFSDNDLYTVVTSVYDEGNNETDFFVLEPISYSSPSGSNIFIANDTYSVCGFLFSNLAEEDDKYGFSLTTNYDGSKLFIGAPYTDYSTALKDTGVVFVYDRLVVNVEVQYDQGQYQPFIVRPPFSPTEQTRVYLNGKLLASNQYLVIFNIIFIDDIGMKAGDILTISSVNFVLTSQLFSQDNLNDLRMGELFGYSLSTNKFGSELIVGVPYDVSNNSQKEGSVIRYTNAGKRFGRLQGVIACNLYEPTYLLLNGQIVNAFTETPLLSAVQTGNTTCTIDRIAALSLPTSGVLTLRNTLTGNEQPMAFSSVNYNTGVVTFAVPVPTKGGLSQTFPATTGIAVLPLGYAAGVANAINFTNIDNIRAYATEDNRLQIILLKNELGQSNNKLNLSVFNGNYLTMLGFIDYVKSQVIQDPHPQTHTQFGYSVKFNQEDSFVVGAPTSTRYVNTTFDTQYDNAHDNTVFDLNLTAFEDRSLNAGSVYMYDYITSYQESLTNIGNYLLAQSCNYIDIDYGQNPGYGKVVDFNDGVVMVGAPNFLPGDVNGDIWLYENASGIPDWHVYRESAPIVNIQKIQKVQLYNNTTNETLTSLDYIDPLQGKLLGVVGENLDYISSVDPANYNVTGFNTGTTVWTTKQVGHLWFNTTTTKFLDYHQTDVTYNSQYWGAVFPGSTVTVYTWVESIVAPISYTGPGTPYDIGQYSVVLDTDNNDNLVSKYYFWVRNTGTVSTTLNKTLSDTIIEQYIANPISSGISFFAPIRPNVFGFYNSQEYINSLSTNLHLGYSVGNKDNSGHQEFQLIRSNFTDDFLNGFVDRNKGYNSPVGLYDRYLDSFSGTDETGAPVPEPQLPKMVQTGIGIRPRQSFYLSRLEALRNYLEYANNVIRQYPINESGNITFLYAQGNYFNTTNYWENIYWWAEGYNENTKARLEVPIYTDLLRLTPVEGMIVGVAQNPDNKREVYIYKNSTWTRIGLEDGTIRFLSSLWDYSDNQIGFGDNFFDSVAYDVYPSVETRYIIRALNEQIYVGPLLEHRNKSLILMFEYIQSESIETQNYIPWLTKTSFADVNYTVRELTANERFQRDNQKLLEGYINEVKPYHVVLKDFYLKYSRTDIYAGDFTDFDLPAVWNDSIGRFVSPQLSFNGENGPYVFGNTNPIWESNSYSNWFANYGTSFSSLPNTMVTRLIEYIDTAATSMYVENSSGLPVTGVVRIGAEEIAYGSIDRIRNRLSGLIRGYNNTTPAEHIAGYPLFMDIPPVLVLDAGRNYTITPKVTAYVDTNLYPAPKREAVLRATMALDKITAIEVIDPGEGYVVEPTIVIDSSFAVEQTYASINFQSNFVQVNSTDFSTGDLIYFSSQSSTNEKIIPDGYYYISVVEITATLLIETNALLIAFYHSYADSIKGSGNLKFTAPELIPSDYTFSVGIRGRAIASMVGTGIRKLNTTLRFDRTSYRPMVQPWKPEQYYSSPYISFGNDASTPVKLFGSLEFNNVTGTVSPAGGTGAVFKIYNAVTEVAYYADITNGGQGYSVGNMITISGSVLGGNSTNNCVLEVTEVNSGSITEVEVVDGTPVVDTSGIAINPSLTSLQGALLPVTGLTNNSGNAVVTVDFSYSGLKPGQVDGTYMYFFIEPKESNEGIYVYDDSLAGGAVIRISKPKFNFNFVDNLYAITIETNGTGYSQGQEIKISGDLLGGQPIVNDAIITITKVNTDTSIFSAIVSGVSVGDYGRFYVKVASFNEGSQLATLNVFSDKDFLIPVSYSMFIWNGTNSSYGYLPEQVVNNYSFTYNVGSIVSYAGYIWQCVNSNNDNEFTVSNWALLSPDDYVLNALDRIEAYYEPTITMPAKDPQQLMKGIQYPNNTYLGNKFAPEDEIPLDFILRNSPFYPRNINLTGVAFNGTTLVVAGDSGESSVVLIKDIETSVFDTYSISESPVGITDLKYSNGSYIITTTNVYQPVWVSNDGVNWFTTGTISPYDSFKYDSINYDITGLEVPQLAKNGALIYNETNFAIGGQTIIKSIDYITYQETFNIASNLNQNLIGLIYVNISGYTGYLAYGKGEEVTSGEGTATPTVSPCSLLYTSTDTNNWTKITPSLTTRGILGATASSNRIVVVGEYGTIYYSTNASVWTGASISGSPVTVDINSVTTNGTIFVAVGDKTGAGTTDPALILISTNGMNWTQVSSQFNATENLNKVIYGSDGFFYAVGDNLTIIRSLNGVNWEDVANAQLDDPYYIVQGNDFLFGYGPEELVPGIVTDTLSMYVKTAPGAYWDLDTVGTVNTNIPYWYKHTGFNMKSVVLTPDINNAVSFSGIVVNPTVISVFIIDDITNVSTRIYPIVTPNNTIGYNINWSSETITLTSSLPTNKSIMIEMYEVGNGEELVRGNSKIYPMQVDPLSGNSMFVFTQNYDLFTSNNPTTGDLINAIPMVYVNGVKYDYVTSFTDSNQFRVTNTSDNSLKILFNELLSDTDYVSYSILAPGVTVRNIDRILNHSIPETQLFVAPSSSPVTIVDLDADISVGTNADNAIVEVNGVRLRPSVYSFDLVNNRITLVTGVTNSDILAITTFNDTSRQWLVTDTYTGILVSQIEYINTSTPVVTVTFTVNPSYSSATILNINGVVGATELNGNAYYVKPVIVSGVTYYELYKSYDSGTSTFIYPVTGNDVSQYVSGGYASPNVFSIPYPDVPTGMDPMTYTDGSRTWVTINGYRISPELVVINPDNELNILAPISLTDVVVVTAMVTGASPNPLSFNINVNKYGTPAVYRTNLEDGSWLTESFNGEVDYMTFYNVSNLVDTITKSLSVIEYSSGYYTPLQVNVNQVKEVAVFNQTTQQQLLSTDFTLSLVEGASALIFNSGVSLNDLIVATLVVGDTVEINGERIRFSTISIIDNTISGLTRGVDGTLVSEVHPEYSVGYGINDSRKLTTDQYNIIWSSTNIVSDSYYQFIPKEDPLQISTTETALFLQSNQIN